ncbi:MAG TPA: cysteine desulfurase-like protein [Nocardioidaceae bacterium]|nr:cysteine desulfurase-like protein [Nocardioidaceae bacterium]
MHDAYDVEAVRAHFPALAEGAAHFDGPGGSQVPVEVAAAVSATLSAAVSNRGTLTPAARRADDIVQGARAAMADLLGADARGIVFGRSMTSLTFDFARTLAKTWNPGDEVVVTRLDHDGNIRPWTLAAAERGVTVRWAEFDPMTGELGLDDIRKVLGPRTRLVAVTAASNLIGTRPDIEAIAGLVHEQGALLYVDAVHAAAHSPLDLATSGADFLVCSPYKFFGPHCGVLAARPDTLEGLQPDKLLPSTDAVPERFELGTLPYELLAGCTAAVDFIAGFSAHHAGRRSRLRSAMGTIQRYEDGRRAELDTMLAGLPGVVSYSRASRRTPTLLIDVEHRSAAHASQFLAERGVNAPAGAFYAMEASRVLGLGDAGALRVGLAPYTNASDIDRLVDGITSFLRTARQDAPA